MQVESEVAPSLDPPPQLVPRFDPNLGRYVWEGIKPEVRPPASDPVPDIVKQSLKAVEPEQPSEQPPGEKVLTYKGLYADGVKGRPFLEPETDELSEYRVDPEVAQEILAGLPEGVPTFIRVILALLMGASFGRPGHS